jgi:1-acyl-sn-glycerol-3-phosphate acyltransferase
MHLKASTSFQERCVRYIRLVVQVCSGLFTVAVLFPFYDRERRWRAVKRWSHGIVAIAGIEVEVSGDIPKSGTRTLGVVNHVSWLDIQVLHSVWAVRFVAKSEVRKWPAIGWLSARTGTLFIDRSTRRRSTRINHSIHEAFADGDAVAVFPEGTTTCGGELLRFHASLLQPAVDEEASLSPVAIRYVDMEGNVERAVAYVGDMSLMESLARIVRVPRIRAEVHFLPVIDSRGQTRRELATIAHASIASALNLSPTDS